MFKRLITSSIWISKLTSGATKVFADSPEWLKDKEIYKWPWLKTGLCRNGQMFGIF
jgi:hypothetical protein